MCDPNRDHENCVDNEQDNARQTSEKPNTLDDTLARDVVAARQEGAAKSDVAVNVQMQMPGASNSDADSNNAEQQKSVYEMTSDELKQYQREQRMGMKIDGEMGVSSLLLSKNDADDAAFVKRYIANTQGKNAKQYYSVYNVDNLGSNEDDANYDRLINKNDKLTDFDKRAFNTIAENGEGKRFGDLTGDDGLAYGILHFTDKSKLKALFDLIYADETVLLSHQEHLELQKWISELTQCTGKEQVEEFFHVNGKEASKDPFWHSVRTNVKSEDKDGDGYHDKLKNLSNRDNIYLYNLKFEGKFDILVSLLRDERIRKLQVVQAKNLYMDGIREKGGLFEKANNGKQTIGSAAIAACFGNSSDNGLSADNLKNKKADVAKEETAKNNSETLSDLLMMQIAAGYAYMNFRAHPAGKDSSEKTTAVQKQANAVYREMGKAIWKKALIEIQHHSYTVLPTKDFKKLIVYAGLNDAQQADLKAGNVKSLEHRLRRMILLLNHFYDIWDDPFDASVSIPNVSDTQENNNSQVDSDVHSDDAFLGSANDSWGERFPNHVNHASLDVKDLLSLYTNQSFKAGRMYIPAIDDHPGLDVQDAVDYNTNTKYPKRQANIKQSIGRVVQISQSGYPINDEQVAHVIANAQSKMDIEDDGKFGNITKQKVEGKDNSDKSDHAPLYRGGGDARTDVADETESGTSAKSEHDNSVAPTQILTKDVDNSDVQATDDAARYELFGLKPYSDSNFEEVIKNFNTNPTKAVAQCILWAREYQNPAYVFPLFQKADYVGTRLADVKTEVDTIVNNSEAMFDYLKNGAVAADGSDPFAPLASYAQKINDARLVIYDLGLMCNTTTELLVRIATGNSDTAKFLKDGFNSTKYDPALDMASASFDASAIDGLVVSNTEQAMDIVTKFESMKKSGGKKPLLSEDGIKKAVGKNQNNAELIQQAIPVMTSIANVHAPVSDEETVMLIAMVQSIKKLKSVDGVYGNETGKRIGMNDARYSDHLHGAKDPAWAGAKEGDIVLEFQNKAKGSYKENQFRHVTTIMRIITVGEIKSRKININRLSIVGNIKSNVRATWGDDHRLACTLGASDGKTNGVVVPEKAGVGLRNKEWKVNTIENTKWDSVTDLLWHDMDGDWVENGISRINSSDSDNRKVYLYRP